MLTQSEIIDRYIAAGWSIDYTWGDGAVHLTKRNRAKNLQCPEYFYTVVHQDGQTVKGTFQP